MPVTYEIDPVRKLIHTVCAGDVNPQEVSDHFRELEHDPKRTDRLNILLDLTCVTSLPEADQVRAVSHELERYRRNMQFNACAIVAGTDALFGMMRMFEVLAEDSFVVTRVFRVTTEAEAWLAGRETQVESSG